MTKSNLTIVILTKNEEKKLSWCLDAVPRRYPVVIIDSQSTDKTCEIARERGCLVFVNPWRGFADQRNYALENCSINTPWVLFIDADEVYPARFYDWFDSEVAASVEIDVYMIPQILFFYGKRLRYAPGYPIYHPRLVRCGRTHFVTNHTGHGEAVSSSAKIEYGNIPYEHYFYNGEVIEWMHKHVDKASQEVDLNVTPGAMMTSRGRLSVILGRSILRPFARFVYHYVLRAGILDGAAGLEYSLMWGWYEATIYLQSQSRRRTN